MKQVHETINCLDQCVVLNISMHNAAVEHPCTDSSIGFARCMTLLDLICVGSGPWSAALLLGQEVGWKCISRQSMPGLFRTQLRGISKDKKSQQVITYAEVSSRAALTI